MQTYSNILSQYSIHDQACLLALLDLFVLGYGLYPPLSLDWHFLLLNLLWLFASGWEYLYFQKLILLYAAAINLLIVLVTTLLAAAMELSTLDVIMAHVTLSLSTVVLNSRDW